jgi:hypothetical protein
MSKATIASLAILKVNWDHLKKDYIENFVPMIVECIRLSDQDVIALPGLQEALQKEFGLCLPLNPIRQILQRAAKHGYLKRQGAVFYRDAVRCSTCDCGGAPTRASATLLWSYCGTLP